jgi:hypothetical protein
MENNDNPADISTIRQLYIDPSKFKNSIGTGMIKIVKLIIYVNITDN